MSVATIENFASPSPRDLLFRFFHPPLKQAISISAFIQPISLIDFLSRQDGEFLFFLS